MKLLVNRRTLTSASNKLTIAGRNSPIDSFYSEWLMGQDGAKKISRGSLRSPRPQRGLFFFGTGFAHRTTVGLNYSFYRFSMWEPALTSATWFMTYGLM